MTAATGSVPGSAADTAGLRTAVLGPGGVGGLLAGLLARGGGDVLCLAGSATAGQLGRQGMRVDSASFGEFSVAVRAAERLAEPVDVCLVTVKALQLEAALDRLPADVLGDALLVPLLNGVEHVEWLRQRRPRAQVVAATMRVESTRVAAGHVRHDSPFAVVELAAGGADVRRVDQLAATLGRAGLDVRVVGDEATLLWGKLTFLAPLALLTTRTGASAGVVRDEHREAFRAVVAEVASVARAEGAVVDEEATLQFLDQVPATMQSSMQRDAAAGRQVELEAIGGAVVRAAARHGLPVPVTTRLVDELRILHPAAQPGTAW